MVVTRGALLQGIKGYRLSSPAMEERISAPFQFDVINHIRLRRMIILLLFHVHPAALQLISKYRESP
jgi:hypothetical protein